jgi:anti-sigma regulatory factor (Ser/Thr protein kinase)
MTAAEFGISRQAVNRYLRTLKAEKVMEPKGAGRNTTYSLVVTEHLVHLDIVPGIAEHRVWRDKVVPLLPKLSQNVREICEYGFTEMFNNVIEHSESQVADIAVFYDALKVELWVADEGVGIFEKIQARFGLDDPREAILELAKGKLTSDPVSHTGEGIFFTSRMFDKFEILSGKLAFLVKPAVWDILLEMDEREKGTAVCMEIRRDSPRTKKAVFDRYSVDDGEFGFSRTVIPVRLLQYEGESLVSRSQAKRLIARFERFKEVILDFKGIVAVGQAFSDEVFRVFRDSHPQVNLLYVNASEEVKGMIRRVLPDRALADSLKGREGEYSDT